MRQMHMFPTLQLGGSAAVNAYGILLVCTWFEAGGENLASGTKALVPKVRVAHDTALASLATGRQGLFREKRNCHNTLLHQR